MSRAAGLFPHVMLGIAVAEEHTKRHHADESHRSIERAHGTLHLDGRWTWAQVNRRCEIGNSELVGDWRPFSEASPAQPGAGPLRDI